MIKRFFFLNNPIYRKSVVCALFKGQSSIWTINRTLSGATTAGQRVAGSDGNEGIFCFLQISSITENSSSDCFVSYPGNSLGVSSPSAEMQSV